MVFMFEKEGEVLSNYIRRKAKRRPVSVQPLVVSRGCGGVCGGGGGGGGD